MKNKYQLLLDEPAVAADDRQPDTFLTATPLGRLRFSSRVPLEKASEQARSDTLHARRLRAVKLQVVAGKIIDGDARAVRHNAAFFDRCPDDLTAEHLRVYVFLVRARPSSLSDLAPARRPRGCLGADVCKKETLLGSNAHVSLPFPLLRAQNRHALEVPRQADQRPLVLHVVQTAGEELSGCPSTDLMMPNTGSTLCLRGAYAARPARVLSRWVMRCTGVADSGNAPGSVKRSAKCG